MADNKDIDINITTTGDTAGAEKVEKSIFAVQDAAKQASAQADVDIAKGKQAAAVQREQAEALKQMVDLEQRVVAAELAESLEKVAKGFKGISPEVDLCVEGIANFLNVLATTGNPIEAVFAVVGTAVSEVVKTYQEAAEQIEQIEKAEHENLKKTAELRREFAAQLRAENLSAFFKTETDALDEQEKVLNRIAKINASERALSAQKQATAGAEAVAGGASAAGAAAQQQGTATDNTLATLQGKLDASKRAVETAEAVAVDLALKAKSAAIAGNDAAAELAAVKESGDARKKADELAKEESANQVVILNEMATAASAGRQAVEKTGQEGLAALTAATTKERDALQAEVTRQGTFASANAKTALEEYNKILANSQVTADELKLLADAQNRVRLSQESMNTAVKEGFDDTSRALDAVLNIIAPVLKKINAQAAEIEDLRNQISFIY